MIMKKQNNIWYAIIHASIHMYCPLPSICVTKIMFLIFLQYHCSNIYKDTIGQTFIQCICYESRMPTHIAKIVSAETEKY